METDEKLYSTGEKLADQASSKFEHLREKMPEFREMGNNLLNSTKDYFRATDHYVHDNSWKAAGMAAALGLIIGLLLHRD